MDVKLKNNLLCKSGMYSFIDKSFLFWKIWGILCFFFLETHHSLLSHCVWVLVSGVLINKVWETEKIEDFIRWTGSTLQKWNHQLEKRLEGGKDTSRTRSLVARVTNVQAHNASHSFPNAVGESAVLQPPREEVYSAFAKTWRARHPVSHICKRKISSHTDPGSVLRKCCHRSQGEKRRSN